MNAHKYLVCLALAIAMVFAAETHGDTRTEAMPLTVYHDSAGRLTETSKRNARKMRRIATRQGYIALWVTANVEFDPNVDSLSENERATQQAAAKSLLMEVLDPLVAEGSVWHPTAGPYIQGPGCIIRANAAGVTRLVRDRRILHIAARKSE